MYKKYPCRDFRSLSVKLITISITVIFLFLSFRNFSNNIISKTFNYYYDNMLLCTVTVNVKLPGTYKYSITKIIIRF